MSGFGRRASGFVNPDCRRPIADYRNLTRLHQLLGLKPG
jgi:hypothetical protein